MITPLIQEDQWMPLLVGMPEWQPSRKRTVVVAPHPDDETLGAGGLIAWQRSRDVPVTVISVTDGEAAYPELDEAERQGLGTLRRAEQERALQTLGLSSGEVVRLGFPDSQVMKHEQELGRYLVDLVDADSLVIAPWPLDWHPDHEACGRVAAEVARTVGAELVFYLFWTWHCRTPDALSGENLRAFPLDDHLLRLKLAALQCHRSQLERQPGEPVLPERFLGPAKRPFETFICA